MLVSWVSVLHAKPGLRSRQGQATESVAFERVAVSLVRMTATLEHTDFRKRPTGRGYVYFARPALGLLLPVTLAAGESVAGGGVRARGGAIPPGAEGGATGGVKAGAEGEELVGACFVPTPAA